MDLNHRPHAYQACALTSLAIGPYEFLTKELNLSKLNITEQEQVFVLNVQATLPACCMKKTFASSLSPQKGGDPSSRSRKDTLLRLHPNHLSYLRRLPPCGQATGVGYYNLSWCDGRCVQDSRTYSPRHADSRLLAIPTSCSRVADYNPN